MRRLVLSVAWLLVAGAAPGAPLPREFTVTPEVLEAAPDYLTQVVVPDANCAAVSDKDSLLVVGRRGQDERHLAVFHLDAEGKPSAEPVWVTLPKPEALAANFNYPLGLLFHPKLPLLYVWQDVNGPPPAKQEKNPEFNDYLEFDHLLVYAIKDGALELVQSGASGAGFHVGLNAGTVGLDYELKNIYVPNAVGGSVDEAGIAAYALDEEGMPDETPDPGAVPTPRKLVKNLTASKGPLKKINRPVILPKKLHTSRYYPSGTGWFAGSEALLMGAYSGCLVYDFHNGGLRQTIFGIPDITGPCTLAGHPTLPAMYMALQDNNHLYEAAQVNGFVTLLPQVATVTGTHFAGLPVVLTKQARLAIGDTKALHLLGLQTDGRLDGSGQRLALPCAMAKAYAYSEKLGRLFVGVDKAK